jgi:MFS family permease
MTLFGLVASATITMILGLVNTIGLFGLAALTVGVFSSIGGPARQAMVADILPERQRAEGYGIVRVGFNVSATVAPAIGGLLAAYSYMYLFVTDAVLSLLTAVVVFLLLPETRPKLLRATGKKPESMLQTFRGYGVALRDGLFVSFCVVSILLAIVMLQFNTTLGVFLRDVHGVSPQYYGYILSMNAVMVVLFQFSVTRRIKPMPQFMAMAIGSVLYAVGFGIYGLVSAYPLFLMAMAIITIGEMIVAPVSQAIAAQMAPEEMRGRYMAVFGFTWVIPGMIGPLLSGLVLDNLDPRWLWYLVALVGFLAAGGFTILERAQSRRMRSALSAGQAGV